LPPRHGHPPSQALPPPPDAHCSPVDLLVAAAPAPFVPHPRSLHDALPIYQAFPVPPDGPGGPDELLVAAVRASVVAPEREVGRWFAWRRLFPADLVGSPIAAGRLERAEPAGGDEGLAEGGRRSGEDRSGL